LHSIFFKDVILLLFMLISIYKQLQSDGCAVLFISFLTLISISIALRQKPAYTVTPQTWHSCIECLSTP